MSFVIIIFYSNQSENELIERLLKFMNIETDVIKSPDESYVLTPDNLTKIMAIQTRFRYFYLSSFLFLYLAGARYQLY